MSRAGCERNCDAMRSRNLPKCFVSLPKHPANVLVIQHADNAPTLRTLHEIQLPRRPDQNGLLHLEARTAALHTSRRCHFFLAFLGSSERNVVRFSDRHRFCQFLELLHAAQVPNDFSHFGHRNTANRLRRRDSVLTHRQTLFHLHFTKIRRPYHSEQNVLLANAIKPTPQASAEWALN